MNPPTRTTTPTPAQGIARRAFLSRGVAGLGAAAAARFFLSEVGLALAADTLSGKGQEHPDRILVVLEMTGGNDGLNTVVPFSRDEYYRLRPTLAIPQERVIKVSDEFGFHTNLVGFERLFKDGRMAVVHGCSYPNPNRSHFSSMGYWHTAVPNGSDSRGWLGRYADARSPVPQESLLINIGKAQSMAVKSGIHGPVVFSDPDRFVREGSDLEKAVFAKLAKDKPATGNETLTFLRSVGQTADRSSEFVRHACAEYRSRMEYGYGEVGVDLRRIAALIKAGSPARIYYLNFGGWDTHIAQAGVHSGLFNRLGDAVQAFIMDLNQMGRGDDVALLAFTEFGRRVKENASAGTDHGVAAPMFVVGNKVKGGFYGAHPSLTDLDEGDLKMTTDFRSVYSTVISEWMGFAATRTILKGDFPGLGIFA